MKENGEEKNRSIIEVSRGVYLVQQGNTVAELFVTERGTYSDGNELGEIEVLVETERERVIRERFSELMASAEGGGRSGQSIVSAPMPGLVRSIQVSVGDTVEKGSTLLVLEAMKMENSITCAESGTIRSIFVEPGTSVEKGTRLLELERGSG